VEEMITDKQVWTRIAMTIGSLVGVMLIAIIAANILG
jgi:hypothetical protein|tara:strand:+ start:640 stop:750 length:111 start_codon:yes stop_codon:yes gene_type:complete